jgi:predicted outer membrane repeat protein
LFVPLKWRCALSSSPRETASSPREPAVCSLCCVPRAENVVFTDNSAVKGGAVHSVAAEPCEDSRCAHVDAAAFVNVGFVGNYAKQRGGALADEVG